jgi:hypothetical protein
VVSFFGALDSQTSASHLETTGSDAPDASQRRRGRRNLTDDQRTAVALDEKKVLSKIAAMEERGKEGGKASGRSRAKDDSDMAETNLADKTTDKFAKPKKTKQDTRAKVAKEYKVSVPKE